MIGRAPAFWQSDGPVPRALSPLSVIVANVTARRVARLGWCAPVPVLCCGNATVGGSGKTTVALSLLASLGERGLAPHALLRGHGGSVRGTRRVMPDDTADEVGDEALLLAAAAPTWTGADRAASARAAIAAGALSLVMDDGLQNPSLAKTSLLVIDGGAGFGNGRVLPAGPLREPATAAAARCHAAVLIGEDLFQSKKQLPASLPVFAARLAPDVAMRALAGQRVVAFAGIGRPEKFFASLRDCGAVITEAVAFADHYRYRAADASQLVSTAKENRSTLVTTPKDGVRLPPDLRAVTRLAGVTLALDDRSAWNRLILSLVGG